MNVENVHSLRTKAAQAVRKVMDPELHISIVELGLLYNIFIETERIVVEMTLTTFGCPLFGVIEEQVKEQVSAVSGTKTISIHLVFDPPWSPEMIAPEARAELGI